MTAPLAGGPEAGDGASPGPGEASVLAATASAPAAGPPPARLSRRLAAAAYLGVDPYSWPWRCPREDALVAHHARVAIGLDVYLGAGALLVLPPSLVACGWFSYTHGDLALQVGTVATIAVSGLLALGPLALATAPWVAATWRGVRGALRGERVGTSRLLRWRPASQEAAERLRRVRSLAIYLGLLVAAAAIAHAVAASRPMTTGRPADVYLLYADSGLPLEREGLCVAFHAVARAARARWGPDAAVVGVLTHETLADALARGRLVFVSSHGAQGGLCLGPAPTDGAVWAQEVPPRAAGPRLRFVYLGACHAGLGEWARALAPAEVVARSRSTTIPEHLWWLLVEGPALVERLE